MDAESLFELNSGESWVPETGSRILVGMSGGLDSTYTAYMLKERGYSVEGAVLKMNEHTDVAAAVRAASELDVPIHIVECGEEFRRWVIENLIDEYSCARTPNPCVICNRRVKIELLTKYAVEHGFARAATGHYAGIRRIICDTLGGSARYFIRDASDISKNQSYVLWMLTQNQLAKLYTPLEGMSKSEVRKSAAALGLSAANMQDSQEICFIPDKDYAGYIERLRGKFPPGDFIDSSGKIIGRHKGIIHYTIGQRKGLGLAMNEHVFVTNINPATNQITISGSDGVFAHNMKVSNLNFQAVPPMESGEFYCDVKIRYAAKPVSALVKISGGTCEVEFATPARAVTPGQSAVFYRDGNILFGGLIDSSF